VLLIDDVITTAESKLNTIDLLSRHDFVVSDVMVLVDREQGGRDQLEKAGYQLHSIATISQLLDYYLRVNRITHDTHLQSRKRLDDLNRFMEFA
jgi:uridine monophosphate synthetase